VKIPENLSEEQKQFLRELKENEIFGWAIYSFFTYCLSGD
jgi:hypothetical protein